MAGWLAGCGTPTAAPPPPERPSILDAQGADLLVDGSLLRITGVALDAAGPSPVLRVTRDGSTPSTTPQLASATRAERLFSVTTELVQALGEGTLAWTW